MNAYKLGLRSVRVGAEPRFDALRRAVKAVFNLRTQVATPYYVYSEPWPVSGGRADAFANLDDAANFAQGRWDNDNATYVAIFATNSPEWPDPYWVRHRLADVQTSGIYRDTLRGASPKQLPRTLTIGADPPSGEKDSLSTVLIVGAIGMGFCYGVIPVLAKRRG